MAIAFPSTPDTGDLFEAAGRTWIYDGTSWRLTPPASSASARFGWEPTTTDLIDNDFQWFYGWKYDPIEGRLVLDEIDDNTLVRLPKYRPGDNEGVYNGMLTSVQLASNTPKHEIVDMNGEGYYNWFTSLTQVSFAWDSAKKTHITMEV
jgi:hypothetical protein